MHALSDNTLTYRVTEEPSEGYQTAESKSPRCQRGQQPEERMQDFPGGAVVKNPPANAGDTGSIPGLGRSHMPRSN